MLRFGQNITKSHFGKKNLFLYQDFLKKKAIISLLYLYQRLKQIYLLQIEAWAWILKKNTPMSSRDRKVINFLDTKQ